MLSQAQSTSSRSEEEEEEEEEDEKEDDLDTGDQLQYDQAVIRLNTTDWSSMSDEQFATESDQVALLLATHKPANLYVGIAGDDKAKVKLEWREAKKRSNRTKTKTKNRHKLGKLRFSWFYGFLSIIELLKEGAKASITVCPTRAVERTTARKRRKGSGGTVLPVEEEPVPSSLQESVTAATAFAQASLAPLATAAAAASASEGARANAPVHPPAAAAAAAKANRGKKRRQPAPAGAPEPTSSDFATSCFYLAQTYTMHNHYRPQYEEIVRQQAEVEAELQNAQASQIITNALTIRLQQLVATRRELEAELQQIDVSDAEQKLQAVARNLPMPVKVAWEQTFTTAFHSLQLEPDALAAAAASSAAVPSIVIMGSAAINPTPPLPSMSALPAPAARQPVDDSDMLAFAAFVAPLTPAVPVLSTPVPPPSSADVAAMFDENQAVSQESSISPALPARSLSQPR